MIREIDRRATIDFYCEELERAGVTIPQLDEVIEDGLIDEEEYIEAAKRLRAKLLQELPDLEPESLAPVETEDEKTDPKVTGPAFDLDIEDIED